MRSVSGAVVGICITWIAVALTRLPRTPLVRPVHAFVAAGVLWAVGDLIASAAPDMAWKQVGLATLYSGAIPLPALWWVIALRWSRGVGAELPFQHRAWTLGPLAFAAAMWLVMITNPWHEAFLLPVVGGRNLYGPFWHLMAIPNYALIVAALGVELETARRVAKIDVWRQAAFLIGASLVTLVGNLAWVVGLLPSDPTSLVLSASAALLVVGMAREGLFGVLPAALPSIAADHPDALVVVGADGKVRYANARAGELLAPLEVHADVPIRTTLEEARLRSDPAFGIETATDTAWWAALTQPGGVSFHGADPGSPRWIHASAWAVLGRRGRLRGHCLRLADRTAQRQAEIQQRQARRLESVASLARTVSVDFRGTFSIIQANAQLLAERTAASPADQRRVARILEAADHGLDAAEELQLYAGSMDPTRVVVELSTIAEEMCGLVSGDLPAGTRIVFERAAIALPIDADPLQLRNGIFNLLMNAVESMTDAGGEIRVETGARRLDPEAVLHLVHGQEEPPGDFAFVRIADQGGGMDPDTEERAFEPFFSSRHKDRGNGLPTVLGIARGHDALLALDNRPGHGCTVTLYVPLTEDAELGPMDRGH